MADRKYNIDEIKLLMPDYITGKLNPDEVKFIESAIDSSPELKSLFDEMKGTIGFVSTVIFKEPEPQYWATILPKIHDRIEKSEENRFSWDSVVSYWKIIVPAAAIILIAIFYFTLFYKQPDATMTQNKEEQLKSDTVNKTEKKEDSKKEIVKEHGIIIPERKSERNQRDKQNREFRINKEQLTDIKEVARDKNEDNKNKEDGVIREDLTSVYLEEESFFSGGAGGFDEDMEEDLNRLNNNEKETLIKELLNSNL